MQSPGNVMWCHQEGGRKRVVEVREEAQSPSHQSASTGLIVRSLIELAASMLAYSSICILSAVAILCLPAQNAQPHVNALYKKHSGSTTTKQLLEYVFLSSSNSGFTE